MFPKKKKTKTSRRRPNQFARPVFRVGCWNLYQIQEEIKPRVAYWADFLFNTMRELHTSRRAGRATFTQNMSSSQTEPTRAVARGYKGWPRAFGFFAQGDLAGCAGAPPDIPAMPDRFRKVTE